MGRALPIIGKAVHELIPGDHCFVRRTGYWHHGIYIGDGEFVHKTAGHSTLAAGLFCMHASYFSAGGGVVRTALAGFVPEEEPKLLVMTYRTCFAPADTVRLALSGLDKESAYRLLESNCEHFACYCRTGERVSHQVVTMRHLLQQLVAVGAALVTGTATMTRMQLFKRVRVEKLLERRGTFLGLRDRTVTVTTVEVNQKRVLGGAIFIATVAAFTYQGVRMLTSLVVGRAGRMSFSITLAPGEAQKLDPEGAESAEEADTAVPTVVRCRRPRTLEQLFARMAEALRLTSSAGLSPIAAVAVWDAAAEAFVPVLELRAPPHRLALPNHASVQLRLTHDVRSAVRQWDKRGAAAPNAKVLVAARC